MLSENLITYKVIDLGQIKPNFFDINQTVQDILKKCSNEPIEIKGETDLELIGLLFMRLADRATEIIYRSESGQATVLFSMLDNDEGIHPTSVKFSPVEFSPEEQKELKAKDKKKEIILDLGILWKDAQKKKDSALKEFLLNIYSVSPKKEKVILQGEVPTFSFLLVLAWFFPCEPQIFYNDILLH